MIFIAISAVSTGPVLEITLNRPDVRNAMSLAMVEELRQALAQAEASVGSAHPTRVVVLRGAGRAFCAGADIAALDELNHAERPINAEQAIAASPKPVIAAIEGACYGGGVQMAVASDLRVASSAATFAVPPARLGVVYPVSATQRMINVMGPSVTKEMLYTAERLDAARALAIGLLNRVVEPGRALSAAIELAERMAGLSQLTLRASKEIVDGLVARDLSAETAIAWVARAAAGPDLMEGKQAFLERRAPQFTWRPGS